MLYGTFRKGRIVLDDPFALSHGQRVRIEPVDATEAPPKRGDKAPPPADSTPPPADGADVPTLYERVKDFIGIADGLPSDMAENHDHYIHGRPKKS
jgi:hypothetical protein